MRERLEVIANVALIVAAVVVSVVAVRLVFFPSIPRGAGPDPAPPELLGESAWNNLLGAGILLDGTSSSAPVTVVEFMDLECSACRQSHLAFMDMKKEFGDSVAHLLVHFPLENHRFAIPAARAAECALAEDRFADYVDLIFEKQDSLGLKTWVSYAIDSGLQDTVSFKQCNASAEPLPRVERGLELGRQIDVRGTPTVLINGWRLPVPAYDGGSYIRAIRAILGGEEPYER